MKTVDQKIVGLGIGDCFRACVASILEFPIDNMPNFWEQTQDTHNFWKLVNTWVYANFKCKFLVVTFTEETKHLISNILCIAFGQTDRSDEDHAVIWLNGLIHDPHPSKTGIINDPDTFAIFIPVDFKCKRKPTNSEILKRFYLWLDERYGDAHPHRQFMKMAWIEAFNQGMNY